MFLQRKIKIIKNQHLNLNSKTFGEWEEENEIGCQKNWCQKWNACKVEWFVFYRKNASIIPSGMMHHYHENKDRSSIANVANETKERGLWSKWKVCAWASVLYITSVYLRFGQTVSVACVHGVCGMCEGFSCSFGGVEMTSERNVCFDLHK